MSKPEKIQISLRVGGRGSVIVDGVDISNLIRPEIDIHNELNQHPTVTVTFVGTEIDVDLPDARVEFSEEQIAALEALGWTKP